MMDLCMKASNVKEYLVKAKPQPQHVARACPAGEQKKRGNREMRECKGGVQQQSKRDAENRTVRE